MAEPNAEADAEILRRIVEHGLQSTAPASGRKPIAYLIAGPPGSGKSRLGDVAEERCRRADGTPVRVDGDHFRAYHPDYAELARTDLARAFAVSQPFASRWADGLRDAAIDSGLDVVIEGVFKTQANTIALLDRLAASGCEVELFAKVIPAPVSLIQIERRFERQMSGGPTRESAPRRVDAAAHNVGYNAIERLVALFEARGIGARISLWDIDNATIPAPRGASWLSVLAGLRSQPMSEREEEFCARELAGIIRMRVARGAPEEPEPGSALEAATALMSA